ncbi:MAG: cupin domain-containing protein [Alphaproteobacteria bacterium]
MAKRIGIGELQKVIGTLYPSPFDEPCRSRERTRLGEAAGLTQFGVNLLRLPPGAWSSQRHWHTGEDEFVHVVSGEVVLVTDTGEEVLRAGDCAGFPANDGDGHHLQNRSGQDAVVLEIGSRVATSAAHYSDIDMMVTPGVGYTHRDGAPYPKAERRGV